MKRVKIAFTLILIIIAAAVSSLFILSYENNRLKDMLTQIQSVYESGDTQRALEMSNELNDFWHKYEKCVTMVIHDDALSSVNISIAKITPFISNENPELIAEFQAIYHQLDQIYEEEFPSWYNIL